jgi:glycosyltransferase involved in cell wall biosynthesis
MINFSTRPPSISVVMPVYNGEQFLAEAIQSILNQTYLDFEFIIIDDGSTDKTSEILTSFRDRRISHIKNEVNIGNHTSRNIGMKIARGKYICAMDADDIAFPERLEKQHSYMEGNKETGICGSFIQIIPSGHCPKFVTDDELLKVAFLSDNYCSHPSLILRKKFLLDHQLWYNDEYRYASDFDLCARGFQFFNVHNIPDKLLQYRRHSGQISSAKYAEQQKYADSIRINQLIENLRFEPDEIATSLHLNLMKKNRIELKFKTDLEKWIETIILKNKICGYYEEERLRNFLTYLSKICLRN